MKKLLLLLAIAALGYYAWTRWGAGLGARSAAPGKAPAHIQKRVDALSGSAPE